jgi:hypothetical protein
MRSWWLPPRLSAPVAALVVLLLGLGTYLHGQAPTPVSAQAVLHHAAAASPGPNEATHATYRVSSSDGGTGTADVWIGYDGSGAATQLALNLTMSSHGHPAADMNARLVEVGPRLLQVYDSPNGPGQLPVPATPVVPAPPPAYSPGQALKGMVVGTLLAQKLSTEPNAYTMHPETLDGVPVYALKPTGEGGTTYYFNAQSYVLEGVDWVQGGSSWQARLTGSSTVPLSAVPAQTFGSGADDAPPPDKPGGAMTSESQSIVTKKP